MLEKILSKKQLREYGVQPEDLDTYTEIVMTRQGRLMANNYAELSRACVLQMYQELY